MHDQDLSILLILIKFGFPGQSRLIVVHWGSSEECVDFQSSAEAKKNADSRSTDRLRDWNGHRSNKQKNIINQWPADHQAKHSMSKGKKRPVS